MPRKLFGLDEAINLAGRSTTIREQFELGKARPRLGKTPLRHWVEIRKDAHSIEDFPVSEADFKFLVRHVYAVGINSRS